MENVKAFLIKVGRKSEVVTLNGDYTEILKNIDADIFDVVERRIGNKYFDFFVDDEGLFKSNEDGIVEVGAFSCDGEVLAGNILIANHDEFGNTTSLSDDDIRLIQRNLCFTIEDYDFVYNGIDMCLKSGGENLEYRL